MRHLLLLLTLCLLQQIKAQDWELRKEQSGVMVYTRSLPNSSFDEFKATLKLKDRTINEVLGILLDIENYDKLYPDCINPKLLKRFNKHHDIHYIEIKSPWPVQHRDAIYEMTTQINDSANNALIKMSPRYDYIEPKENLKRIKKGSGYWELKVNEDTTMDVTYQFHGDPGGSIPAWLANSFVVSHPLKTMEKLQQRLNIQYNKGKK